jgi:hypothetical protein
MSSTPLSVKEALANLRTPSVPTCGDKVRLRATLGDLLRGSVGVVIGHYTDNGDLALDFNGVARRISAIDVADIPAFAA